MSIKEVPFYASLADCCVEALEAVVDESCADSAVVEESLAIGRVKRVHPYYEVASRTFEAEGVVAAEEAVHNMGAAGGASSCCGQVVPRHAVLALVTRSADQTVGQSSTAGATA